MKKLIALLFMLPIAIASQACDACEAQQPALLKGITHGAGPQSNWDYVIVIAMALIVVLTLYFSIKWIFIPGERNRDHIKRTILNFD